MIQQTAVQKLVSTVLAQHGIAVIWDFHVAAAVAYEVGDEAVAASLIEIAEAAEEEWMRQHAVSVD